MIWQALALLFLTFLRGELLVSLTHRGFLATIKAKKLRLPISEMRYAVQKITNQDVVNFHLWALW